MRESTDREFHYFATPAQLAEWEASAAVWTREAREEAAKPTAVQRGAMLGWKVVK